MRPFFFKLFLSCFGLMLAACGDRAESMSGSYVFENPQMVTTMPAVVETHIGGHRIAARIDQCNPENQVAPSCQHTAKCFYGDALVLSVWRDASHLYSFGYCSAYANAWLRVYGDARGDPYVFAGYSEGRGPRATSHAVMVFAFPQGGSAAYPLAPLSEPLENELFIERLGDNWRPMVSAFITMAPVDEHQNLTYTYKVTAAENGGLIIDAKAVSCPDSSGDQCGDQPKFKQMRIGG